MIKYLQIDKNFNAAKMQEEVLLLEEEWWNQHYNKAHYEGQWSILPLRSMQGTMENVVSVHNAVQQANHYKDTALLTKCPYIKSVLDFFQCEKTSVRLMKLHAGAMIKEHSDLELSFEEGEVRIHIPIITSPQVEFYLEEERVMMQEGECWYLNLSLKHSVRNNGTTDRIHLVIDCKVNDWLKKLFAECFVVQKQIEEKTTDYNKEERVKIIRELRLLNTPAALELAEQMEKELQ